VSSSGRRLGYEALGFTVWHGARWYVRRRFGHWPRRIFLAALVGAGVAVAAESARRHG